MVISTTKTRIRVYKLTIVVQKSPVKINIIEFYPYFVLITLKVMNLLLEFLNDNIYYKFFREYEIYGSLYHDYLTTETKPAIFFF